MDKIEMDKIDKVIENEFFRFELKQQEKTKGLCVDVCVDVDKTGKEESLAIINVGQCSLSHLASIMEARLSHLIQDLLEQEISPNRVNEIVQEIYKNAYDEAFKRLLKKENVK